MENMYEIFGLEEPKLLEKNKNVTGKKTANNKTKKAETKIEQYALPLTIATAMGNIIMNATDDKRQASEKEVREFVAETFPYYNAGITAIQKKGKSVGVVLPQTGIAKGSISINNDSVMYFGSSTVDISSIEKGTVEVIELIKLLKEQFPYLDRDDISCTIWSNEDQKVLIANISGKAVTEIQEPEEKITFHFLTEDLVEVSKENYQVMLKEKRLAAGEDSADVLLSLEDMKLIFPESIPVDSFVTIMIEAKDKNEYFICQNTFNTPKSTAVKETRYNIDGKTISLLFRDYAVTSADFNGKAEVSEKEIINYLVEQGHREFKFVEFTIQEFAKHGTILVSTKGSKKGATAPFPAAVGSIIKSIPIGCSQYILFEGITYMAHHHPCYISAIAKTDDSAFFEWTAPKIPGELWDKGYQLAEAVYQHYGTEVLMDLYYSEQLKKYAWNVPMQTVTTSTVDSAFEPYFQSMRLSGLVKVGQFHSHGRYSPFFSTTDDQDEVHPGIYGVWGNFGDINRADLFVMRCVAEVGGFISLTSDMVFATSDHSVKNYESFVADWWLRIVYDYVRIQQFHSIDEPQYLAFELEVEGKNDTLDALVTNNSTAELYCLGGRFHVYGLNLKEDGLYLHKHSIEDQDEICLLTHAADIASGRAVSIGNERFTRISDFLE